MSEPPNEPSRVDRLRVDADPLPRETVPGSSGNRRGIEDIAARTQARLRVAAEGIRRGEATFVKSVHPAGIGVARSGLAPGEEVCTNYLVQNRLRWWELWPDGVPRTGPLSGVTGAATDVTTLLLNEFCSSLTTIVGSDLGDLPRRLVGQRIPWDGGMPGGRSPNATSGVEFWVRGALPGSRTTLEMLPVDLGGDLGVRERIVLINDQGGVQDAEPLRASVFFDFAVAQRAVALEYGFAGPRGLSINPGRVELLAFAEDGAVIVTSMGTDLGPGAPIQANTVFNVIGVRDRAGAIRTLELRFQLTTDPRTQPAPYFQPHLIRRVWHEPLPPAAVTQGTMAFEFDPNPDRTNRDPLPAGETGVQTLSLPFRCNRAIVLMRGFKLQFLDEAPHHVNTIEAGVAAPAVFEVERRGSISFAAIGNLSTAPRDIPGVNVRGEPPPFRVLVYYTVVAWDADQLEILAARGEKREDPQLGGTGQNIPHDARATVAEPCSNLMPGSDPTLSCGPLFGGLQGFRYQLFPQPWGPFAQSIEKFGLSVGQMGGGRCDLGSTSSTAPWLGMVSPTGVAFADLGRTGGHIEWNVCTLLAGGDGLYLRNWTGLVLTGRSMALTTYATPIAIALPIVGPRPKPTEFFATLDGDLARPIEGIVAFLGLGLVYCEPNGPLRDLEIEVSGMDYDGHCFSWQLGGGVLTLPLISNEDPARFLFAWPAFGALVRKTDAQLGVQDLLFNAAVVGLVSQTPDQYGMLRNDGNVPINVAGAVPGGPNVAEYAIWIHHRGQVFTVDQLSSHGPVVLNPGEALTASGWFVPQADAPSNQPPRTAFIDFPTSSSAARQARMMILGHTEVNRANGVLIPTPVINFGEVDVAAPNAGLPAVALRNAVLESAGQSPLFVTIGLQDPNTGFRIRGFDGNRLEVLVNGVNGWQLDPGNAIIVHLEFVPVREGPVDTRLVVETNDADPNNRRLTTVLRGVGR